MVAQTVLVQAAIAIVRDAAIALSSLQLTEEQMAKVLLTTVTSSEQTVQTSSVSSGNVLIK